MYNAKKLGLEKYPIVKKEIAKDYFIDVFEKERVAFHCGYDAGYSDGYADSEKSYDEDVWQSFRREAAKDAMCAMITATATDSIYPDPDEIYCMALCYADELIKQLKEEKEK